MIVAEFQVDIVKKNLEGYLVKVFLTFYFCYFLAVIVIVVFLGGVDLRLASL